MPSRNATVADAVVAALNASGAQSSFVLQFTAVRRPAPVTDLTKLKNLTVSVIPAGDQSDQSSRDSSDHDITILIGIEKLVTSTDLSLPAANTEIDQLMQLVEQVSDYSGLRTIALNNGGFQDSTIRVLSDVPSLMSQKVFRGIVAVTFLIEV